MRRPYFIVDVFAKEPLSGNPLAVVMNADGLDAARMQAIAREFNLSETAFVLTPQDPVRTARLRIFTPNAELPFAGHPTIGAAALLAELRASEFLKRREVAVILEEEAGAVACGAWRSDDGTLRASLSPPMAPHERSGAPSVEALARALSLEPSDIGFDSHLPSIWSAGAPFIFAPLRTREALTRAHPNPAAWPAIGAAEARKVFAYAKHGGAAHVHARMFAPDFGIAEDPATGSAAAAFAGLAVLRESPEDGEHELLIAQGEDMGRPSLIGLTLSVEGGVLTRVTVSGAVARVAEGQIRL